MQEHEVLQQRKDLPPSGWNTSGSHESSSSCPSPVRLTRACFSILNSRNCTNSSLSLPDNCTFDQAALAEPLSVLLHASRRADLSPSTPSTVLVFGVGAIGLLACALAKSYGATKVVAIDINQARLNFAREQGFAEQVFCLPVADRAKTTEEQLRRAKENISAALSAFNMPDGFDVIFECTGAEPCIQMSIHVSTSFHIFTLTT